MTKDDENINGDSEDNLKHEIIKEIKNNNKEVKCYILRHKLTNIEALKIEATLIDVFKLNNNLSNLVSGNDKEHGISEPGDLIDKYAKAFELNEESKKIKFIIFKVKQGYSDNEKNFDEEAREELWKEATRKAWKLNKARIENVLKKSKVYALSVVDQKVKNVFEIKTVKECEDKNNLGRCEFELESVSEEIKNIFWHYTLPKEYKTKNCVLMYSENFDEQQARILKLKKQKNKK